MHDGTPDHPVHRGRGGHLSEPKLADEPRGLELGEVAPSTVSPDLDLPIEELELSERPRNCLKRAQVNSVGELLTKTEDDLAASKSYRVDHVDHDYEDSSFYYLRVIQQNNEIAWASPIWVDKVD